MDDKILVDKVNYVKEAVKRLGLYHEVTQSEIKKIAKNFNFTNEENFSYDLKLALLSLLEEVEKSKKKHEDECNSSWNDFFTSTFLTFAGCYFLSSLGKPTEHYIKLL